MGEIFIPQILSGINDYIEPVATFTTWTTISQVQVTNWHAGRVLPTCRLACSLSITSHCHGNPNFVGTLSCCHSSTLSVLCDCRSTGSKFLYWWLINLVPLINSIASKTSRSTEVTTLSAFLRSGVVLFELATVHVVIRTGCHHSQLPFNSLFLLMEQTRVSVFMERHGSELSVFMPPTVYMYIQ